MIVCVPQRLSQNLETFNVSSQISIILSTTSLSSISLATKNNFANKLLLLSILSDLLARVLPNIAKKKKKKKIFTKFHLDAMVPYQKAPWKI